MVNHTCDICSSDKVIKEIPTGVNPAGMDITPDGKYLYVANSNNYGLINQDTVSVIDLEKNMVIKTITDVTFSSPNSVKITNNKCYVMNSSSSTISIINTDTNQVIGTISGSGIDVLDGPSIMVITPDKTKGYVNNYGINSNGNHVSVIDLINDVIIATIIIGDNINVPNPASPADLAISPDGKKLYVVNYANDSSGNPSVPGYISIIDVITNKIVDTIGNIGLYGQYNIRISPNGKFAYISNFGSNNFNPIGSTISVLDLYSNLITNTIDLSIQPAGIAFSPNGETAYVNNYNVLYSGLPSPAIPPCTCPTGYNGLTAGDGIVNIIKTSDHTVCSKNIKVSQGPGNIISSPNGKYLYVSSYVGNVINVIKLDTWI